MTAFLGSHLIYLIARRLCHINVINVTTAAQHHNETNRNVNNPGVNGYLPLICVGEAAILLEEAVLHNDLEAKEINLLPKQSVNRYRVKVGWHGLGVLHC
jgi:hypothetical protein